jgi:two-component system response regulator YesN
MYRVMVIDDEPIIRDGIVSVINGNGQDFEVVAEAGDGKAGLEMLAEVLPDVLITDICMPLLGGIELIELARTVNPDIKFIVISGYDDFEYVRRALQLGVCDYVLKPVEPAKLIATLEKLQADLDRQNDFFQNIRDLQGQVELFRAIMRNQLLYDLLTGKVPPEQLQPKLKNLGIPMEGHFHTVAILKIKRPEVMSPDFNGRDEIFQCYLVENIEAAFGGDCRAQVCNLGDDKVAVILNVTAGDYSAVFLRVNQILKRILIAIQRNLNAPAYAALGRFYRELPELKHAYREAKEALQHSLLQEKGNVVNYEDINIRPPVRDQRPPELERALIQQVKLCEKEQALQTLGTLMEYLRNLQSSDPLGIKRRVFEFAVLLLRTVETAGGLLKHILKEERISPYEKALRCETFSDLEEFTVKLVTDSLEELEKVKVGKGYSLVEQAREIIAVSYQNPELSLDDLAAKLFISPNYFRSIFKQQVGESFVEYLTGMRMAQARELLNDPSLKVTEIAGQVGYVDQHYFSICFKKYYGLTPSEYREWRRTS